MEIMDPYLASIIASRGCDRDKYRAHKLPDDMNIKNTYHLLKEIPLYQMYQIGKKYNGNPQKAKEEYMTIIQHDMERLQTIEDVRQKNISTTNRSLKEYSTQLCEAIMPSLFEECGCINFCILSTIGE